MQVLRQHKGSLRTQARDGASSNLNQDFVDERSLAREEESRLMLRSVWQRELKD